MSDKEGGAVRVEIGPSVIFQKLQDEVVLLNMETQQYFGLDDVGASMWHLLLEHKDVAAAASCLCADYAVDEVTAYNDIGAFVRDLADVGLLKILQ